MPLTSYVSTEVYGRMHFEWLWQPIDRSGHQGSRSMPVCPRKRRESRYTCGMRRLAHLLLTLPICVLVTGACAAEDGVGGANQLIENYSPPGGGLVWTCPDGTVLSLTSEVSKQSTLCLGIDGSECRGDGVPGPGDPECDDPAFNGFKGTCVEEFFSCFQPTGTCTLLDNGNQEWSDGALQDRNIAQFLAAYVASGATEPCIKASLHDGYVSYSP